MAVSPGKSGLCADNVEICRNERFLKVFMLRKRDLALQEKPGFIQDRENETHLQCRAKEVRAVWKVRTVKEIIHTMQLVYARMPQ